MTFARNRICGDSICGCELSSIGIVRNLRVKRSAYDAIRAEFDLDTLATLSADDVQIAVYVDGQFRALLPPTATSAEVANLSEGTHTIDVKPVYPYAPLPDGHGDSSGQRAYVEWAPSTDSSVVSYTVQDISVGTYLATVTTIEIAPRSFAKPDTGTGHGRISISGAFNGATCNETLSIQISASGQFDWTLGSEGDTGVTFSGGDSVSLSRGALVTFHDPAAAYVNGDTWTTQVGPRAWALTDALDPGEYSVYVFAADAAGNVNEGITPVTFTIAEIPPMPDVSLAYNGDSNIEVTWASADPGDIDGVYIYSNYCQALDAFLDYIIEDGPTATVASASDTWELDTSATGDVYISVRPYKGAAIRNDATVYTFTLPPTAENLGYVLGNPTSLVASPSVGGTLAISCKYLSQVNDDIHHINVYILAPLEVINWASPTHEIPLAMATGYPMLSFAWTSGGLLDGAEYTVYARAAADAANTILSLSYASGTATADGAVPTFTGQTLACPQ